MSKFCVDLLTFCLVGSHSSPPPLLDRDRAIPSKVTHYRRGGGGRSHHFLHPPSFPQTRSHHLHTQTLRAKRPQFWKKWALKKRNYVTAFFSKRIRFLYLEHEREVLVCTYSRLVSRMHTKYVYCTCTYLVLVRLGNINLRLPSSS